MKFTKNQILTVEIEETNMLGFGVVKVDGAVVFIQNGVAGDSCEIKIIKCAKNYSVARIEKMISPSDKRIVSSCKHFHRCGGCSFQHIEYECEKELKEKSVQGFLQKEGLSDLAVLPIISTNETEGYRNKAQFPVSFDDAGKVICGFYAPKSHKVCALDDCNIQNPIFIQIAKSVCSFLTKQHIPPYCEADASGLVRHIYLRIAQATGEIMLCLVLKENAFPNQTEFVSKILSEFPEIASICINIQPENNNVILGKETIFLYGKEKITDEFFDRRMMLSPLAFYQVNHNAAELLYKTAFDMARIDRFDSIIDLYCGIGSISLSTHAACPITGVEIIPEAVEDAKRNALLNGIDNANFICGDAKDAFRLIQEFDARNPLLIVDPPRKGLTRELITDIAEHGIRSVLYISCGPDTFARDLGIFRSFGYDISPVQPVDLFPRTSHVENIAFLSRKEVDHKMKLDHQPFQMIQSGQKTIELRLNDEKRQKIKVGDRIEFTDNFTDEKLLAVVKQLHQFDSFEALYSALPLTKCGYSLDGLTNASPNDMERFYSREQQAKYGVVGIEIRLEGES